MKNCKILLAIGNNINFRIFTRLFPNKQITILCPVIEVICYNVKQIGGD